MESFVADVLLRLITWVPWLGLAFAVGGVVFGVRAMGESKGEIGRNFFLLSITVSLITGLFVGLVMVQ